MHLRILSSVFLIEIFDLPNKDQKYRKELLLNHSQNTKFHDFAGHVWVDFTLKSWTSNVRYFEVIYTRQQNTRLQSG